MAATAAAAAATTPAPILGTSSSLIISGRSTESGVSRAEQGSKGRYQMGSTSSSNRRHAVMCDTALVATTVAVAAAVGVPCMVAREGASTWTCISVGSPSLKVLEYSPTGGYAATTASAGTKAWHRGARMLWTRGRTQAAMLVWRRDDVRAFIVPALPEKPIKFSWRDSFFFL
jgi:hypothetical protein